MENFRRLFAIKNGNVGGWSDSDQTSFIISVENDTLSIKWKSGRNMFAHEINTAFGWFIQEYEKEFGKIAVYKRRRAYRFCYRQGSSGCQDTFIEIDKGDGFPERKFIMHETCFGKSAGFTCFVYDFLDLCVAAEFFGIEEDSYSYSQEEIDYEMTSVKPRLTQYENGWTRPWKHSTEIVYLTTCREKPEDMEGEEE